MSLENVGFSHLQNFPEGQQPSRGSMIEKIKNEIEALSRGNKEDASEEHPSIVGERLRNLKQKLKELEDEDQSH
ncbi:MAG: hypothetical protein COU47_00040 [Candidatus Niyogibacteria bacterium CG10_big_fil_rev_8_21_14_0_10_46_36]|uniref:Uncharacterized protein n=1 Tax=Candidatus Niyogibacteria bacterium CG10_big_fil_rev_8_21_14_0_10_46_36 TaxID=1974726 RepID=A0A2H0TE44_9BACT|nr:MAG: hypothetical protein COU47_00040 [Candidatus Niyogibacteria bacterium CG10_big_fil_rev_8_21_14_0_10_46_36]